MILSSSKPRNPTLSIPLDDYTTLIEDKIILPPKQINNLLPKEAPIPSPKEKSILSPNKIDILLPKEKSIPSPMDESTLPPKGRKTLPSKARYVPPPHDRPSLLPTPLIPPLYDVVPPPSSYRDKRPTSPIVQPKRPQPIHHSLKKETKPIPNEPNSSQPSAKTRRNHCAREHQWRHRARDREVASQTISSPKTPTAEMISFSPKQDVQPNSTRRKMFKTNNGSSSIPIKAPILINLGEEIGENVVNDENVDPNISDDEYEYVDVDNDLFAKFSRALILAPSNEQSDSALEHGPCLEIVIAPSIVLNVAPLACCPSS